MKRFFLGFAVILFFTTVSCESNDLEDTTQIYEVNAQDKEDVQSPDDIRGRD